MGGAPHLDRASSPGRDADASEAVMTEPKHLLERFNLITEDDLASLLGVSVKTLKNRPHRDLPSFVTAGRKRLFKADAVEDYLKARTVTAA